MKLYQSLILLAIYGFGFCEELYEYHLVLERVCISGNGMEERIWDSVYLFKYKTADKFIFYNEDLNLICGGPISSNNTEIYEVYDRVVKFSLLRGTNQLFIIFLFTQPLFVQPFFGTIRLPQSDKCGREFMFDKLIQYEISNNAPVVMAPVQLLALRGVYYTKKMSDEWFDYPKTFNFSLFGNNVVMQDIRLVLQSKTFNVSDRIGTNMYVLCSTNITTHYFIIQFSDSTSASNFNMRVRHDVDHQINCSTFWLTRTVLQQIDSL